ncbi:SURF1 family protein [Rhizorhabdus dicambivorans]|uniref:SURF1-like protein n=1 Tax=Rhizorhabdus dicambivorans TaxID=1850238 RepID=A0A2A4G206_9SPHN|nr:SURF1 family protein [Rhizorhabdus dicambivorans]ATE66673.1 SURF1 family protein [Rhizorhabdus dicambivorans]PCE44043.1 SURF1 family protein [Rhizorhabdus dicambivorans]
MRRLPILATLVVGLAVAAMIALGLWQLRRAEWKEGLLASYRAARHEPALYGLPADLPIERAAFRRAHILCRISGAPVQVGGFGRGEQPGFRNILGCTLIDGRRIMADLGWSPPGVKPALPAIGQRIEGDGLLIPDEVLAKRVLGGAPGAVPLLIVLEGGAPGLSPSVAPSIETIPNNHRSYAVQWFLFAAVALIIYGLALWKRSRAR